MFKVKRAIIMAAGKGTRMQPLTLKVPKPLIEVNGVKIIDTIISSLKENGIDEIYVVVGYMKEKFKVLKDVTLIDNPYYNSCNNISSLYVARNFLEDSIIIDGDQIIYDSAVLKPEFERSGYNSIKIQNEYTNEWVMQVEKDLVKSCSKNGRNNGWQLYSISRWNSKDAKKLKEHVEIEFKNKNNTDIYWDEIVMFDYLDEYSLGILPMKKGDVVEVDNLYELVEIDSNYSKYIERFDK